MGETVGASGRLNLNQVGLHWDCSSRARASCSRLSCASHDSAILTAAHKSGVVDTDTGMLGLSAVAVAVEFGDDGMLRLAMLAQEVMNGLTNALRKYANKYLNQFF